MLLVFKKGAQSLVEFVFSVGVDTLTLALCFSTSFCYWIFNLFLSLCLTAGCFLFAKNNSPFKKSLTKNLLDVLLKSAFQKLLSS